MKRFLLFASIAACSSASVACVCIGSCPAPDAGGPDLYRVAVAGAPGGSLLSVWGDRTVGRSAFLAGGYVSVDHAMITDGHVGRLVEYQPGTFTTRCTTDEVLWWTTGVYDGGTRVVYAAGEGGRVLRYRNGACETLAVDPALFPDGAPTFWGVYAASVDDVWFVGGSALPTGPRGVLVHYDGNAFTRETSLPAEALAQNLYKIDRDAQGGLLVVGAGGVIIRRDPGTGQWASASSDVRADDNRLFTVSCGGGQCFAVGGAGSGFILRDGASGWTTVTSFGTRTLDDLPGLNGVWVQDAQNVFVVGVGGFTMHTNGSSLQYQPPTPPTTATLHGVGGTADVVLAVGGELGVTNTTQHGVILVRGDGADTFTLDGQSYMASGSLRTSLGGTGQ